MHPRLQGETRLLIPDSIDEVTVVISGASGGGGQNGVGGPGLGGSAIAILDTSVGVRRDLTFWLGQSGEGRTDATEGWAAGGPGGQHTNSPEKTYVSGGTGGGASAIEYTIDGHDVPLMVGGGGGGGGGGWFGGHGGEAGPAFGHVAGPSGGGGGGSSYLSDVVKEPIGYALAPHGDGRLTIYPRAPLHRFECDGSDAKVLDIPDGIGSYAFFAMGGAGEHGHNDAPEGSGAFVTGTLDVRGLEQLHYWVGCSGYHDFGAGYGTPGTGGAAEQLGIGNDGGRGGGATAIATTEGQVLVAAGGGGGTGGDVGGCTLPYGEDCGGYGGNSGGAAHTRYPATGGDGGSNGLASGGRGGCASCHHDEQGHLSPDGGHGADTDDDGTGAGGGGGAGYPAGGAGGHHNIPAPGGGGGAGGSYTSPSRVTDAAITASGHLGSGYLLLIPVQRNTTTLTVTATAVGDAAPYATQPFVFTVACALGPLTTLDATVALRPGQSHEYVVDQHATCTVEETGTAGATIPAGTEIFEVGTDPVEVTMENAYEGVDLFIDVLSELVDAEGNPAEGVTMTIPDLRIAVECRLDGHPLTLPVPVADGVIVVPGGESWGDWQTVLEDLPQGAECDVAETANGGATSVRYVVNGGEPETAPATVTLEPEAVAVQVLNAFEVGSISVRKAGAGDDSPPEGTEFPIEAQCEFHGQPVVFDATPTLSLELTHTGELTNLPIGADCTLTETDRNVAVAVEYYPSRTIHVAADSEAIITNFFDAGNVIVEVHRRGPGTQWQHGGYSVNVSCSNGLSITQDLPAEGGVLTFGDLLTGTTCTVTELDTGGATEVTYASTEDPTPSAEPVQVVVPDSSSTTVTITNTYLTSPIELVATQTGPGAHFDTGAIMRVQSCEFDGVPFDLSGPSGTYSVELPRGGGSAMSPPVPVGSHCEVEVTDTGGAPYEELSFNVLNGGDVDAPNAITRGFTVADPLLGQTAVEAVVNWAVAPVTVTVANEGDGASFANAPFEVQVTCRIDGDPLPGFGVDGVVTLHFAPDGSLLPDHDSAQLDAVAVGAGCEAVETVHGGASEWGTTPPATTIEAGGSLFEVTNVFFASTLTVRALVSGNDVDDLPGAEFVFDAACTFNGLPIGPTPTLPITFHLQADDEQELVVPNGADCTIIETFDDRATAVTPDRVQSSSPPDGPSELVFTNVFDADVVTVRELVTGAGADTYGTEVVYRADLICSYQSDGELVPLPDDGRLELSESNGFSGAVPVPVGALCGVDQVQGLASELVLPEPIPVALGNDHVLEVESVYDLGALTVQKDALGQFDPDLAFGFETFCTFDTGFDVVPIPLNAFAEQAYELGDGEVILLEVLVGAECATTEVQAHDPLRTVVEPTGFDAGASGVTATNLILEATPSAVLVTNYFVGSLPLTGAELSALALWLAIAALLVGGVLVAVKLSRRRAAQR